MSIDPADAVVALLLAALVLCFVLDWCTRHHDDSPPTQREDPS